MRGGENGSCHPGAAALQSSAVPQTPILMYLHLTPAREQLLQEEMEKNEEKMSMLAEMEIKGLYF